MSVGFRIFLLMLLGFLAVWVYRFRRAELGRWVPEAALRDARHGWTAEGRSSYVNPVDDLVDPSVRATAWVFESTRFEPERRGPFDPELDPRSDEFDDIVYDDAEGDAAWESLPGDHPGGQDDELVGLEHGSRRQDDAPEPSPHGADAEALQAYEEHVYEVGRGDSLWKISKTFLGKGTRSGEILALNRDLIEDPNNLPEGLRIRIRVPVSSETSESLKEDQGQDDKSVEEGSAEDRSAPEHRAGDEVAASEPTLHRVKKNENLTKIAKRYFPGDSRAWERIFATNKDKLSSPDKIRNGMVLKIPDAGR